MPIRTVRLGTPRTPGEGLRIGTVRRPPRGVRKEDFGRLDYFDVWLPDLSPSPDLVTFATGQPLTPARWKAFTRRYRSEMGEPTPRHLIALLAALAKHASFSVGCYCADESRCHRGPLGELLRAAGAEIIAAEAKGAPG